MKMSEHELELYNIIAAPVERPKSDIQLFNEKCDDESPFNKIKIKQYDLDSHFYVRVGANRENDRIIRVARTFLKAVTLVGEIDKTHIPVFYRSIIEILDHKGVLMVNWKTKEAFKFFRKNIENAWYDECEVSIWHFINADDMEKRNRPYVEV
jgi:hypothetical protein